MNPDHRIPSRASLSAPAASQRALSLATIADRAAAARDIDAASAAYREAIALSPEAAPSLRLRFGLMLLGADRILAALETLRALTADVPTSVKAWQALGAALREAGDPAAADHAFTRALALAPGDPLARLSRAQVATDLGRPSISLHDQALAADPGSAAARIAAAGAYAGAGLPDRAETLLRERLMVDPGWVDGWMALASLRHRTQGRDAFHAVLDAARRARPGDAALSLAVLRAFAAAGDHGAVLARVRPVRDAIGDSPPLRLAEAEALSETGRDAEAEPLLESLAGLGEPVVDLVRLRHALRTARPERAVTIGTAFRADVMRFAIPYLGTAWRLLDDPRRHWLEGDERLVGRYPLGLAATEITAIADHLRGLHTTRFAPYEQSLRGGTQTEGMLLGRDDPPIRLLRARLEEAVRAHIDQLPPPDPGHPTLCEPRGRFRFSGSWSVRLTDGGHHVNHVHSEGWLSSACHIALPSAVSDPCAADRAGWLALGEPPRELGLALAPAATIRPVAGQLVLFPSTMWHGTTAFTAGERLTVAFDVKPLR